MVAFGCQGFVFISTTTRLPLFSERWDLGELGLSGLLLMVVLLAGVGSVLAERLAVRRDSATLLRTGFALMAVALVLTVVEVWPVFLLGLALYGVALGPRRREHQHAGGRGRARARASGAAVDARRVDLRRHPRRRPDAGDPRRPGDRPGRGRAGAAARRGGAVPASRRLPHHQPRRRRAVATDRAGRPGDGALLHGRHGRGDLGTDLPRPHLRHPDVTAGAGDLPLPRRVAGGPHGRRRARTPPRRRPRAARRRAGVGGGAAARRRRAHLAGRGRGLHAARASAPP